MTPTRNEKLPMTALILAGGRSRRMGRDKAFLPLGEKTVVEFLIERLSPLFRRVAVVTKERAKFAGLNVDIIEDLEPDSSSMIGLYSGLAGSGSVENFVVACDAPFIVPELIEIMAPFASAHEAVVLTPAGSAESDPLPGFYRRDLIEMLRERIGKKEYALRRFVTDCDFHAVSEPIWRAFDPEGRAFLNMNTPDEYRKIREREVALTLS